MTSRAALSAPPSAVSAPAGDGANPAAAHAGMLLVCAIWGANFSVVKGAFAFMPPLAFTAARFAIASVLLTAILRLRAGRLAVPRGAGWRLVWLGVVGNTVYQVAFTLSLAYGTAANSSLILSTMPVMVAVLGEVLGIERTTPRVRWGMGLATAGVVGVIAAGGVSFDTATTRGDLCAVAATLCWAAYTLGLRSMPKHVTPLEVTTFTTLTGTPGLLLVGAAGLGAVDWAALPPPAWGALAYTSVLSLVVAYFIWNASVQRVGANRTVVYMCLTPLVAVLVAWLTLGERIVPIQGVGGVLIVAGVVMTAGRRGSGAAGQRSSDAEQRSSDAGQRGRRAAGL